MNTNLSPMMTSDFGGWETPDELLAVIREFAPIGLDPCTTPANPCGAAIFFTPSEDGLALPWPLAGLIYVNPPYGRGIGRWTDRCCQAGSDGGEVIALVPARTDARWWHSSAPQAACVCFLRGRLRFRGAPSGAPFPSALIYFGKRGQPFANIFKRLGWIVWETRIGLSAASSASGFRR